MTTLPISENSAFRLRRSTVGSAAVSIRERSCAIARFFDLKMDALITGWITATLMASAIKILTAPVSPTSWSGMLAMVLPYLVVALAPIAGYRLAAGSFQRGLLIAQPTFRLAVIGRWRNLDVISARSHPDFGPAGFLVSLLVGILLNVPVRTFEYLTAVPAIGAEAPAWAHSLYRGMTGDVIILDFLYMVSFVMALRAIPLFPRMLAFTWVVDLVMQFSIARRVAAAPGLPPEIGDALGMLLRGNVDKVLISVAVWLPYLLLSERVNVTYRLRRSVSA